MKASEVIEAVAADCGESKATVKRVIESLTAVTHQLVGKGDDVPINGLGRIRTVRASARTGRNPSTGEAIQIAAKNRVTFVAAKALKDAAN